MTGPSRFRRGTALAICSFGRFRLHTKLLYRTIHFSSVSVPTTALSKDSLLRFAAGLGGRQRPQTRLRESRNVVARSRVSESLKFVSLVIASYCTEYFCTIAERLCQMPVCHEGNHKNSTIQFQERGTPF